MMQNLSAAQSSSIQRNSFFITALFCAAIPGSATLKAVAIALLWLYTLSANPIRVRSIIWFLSVLFNVAFCSEVALLHGVSIADTTNQLSRLILFFLVLGAGASTARAGVFDARAIDKLIISISAISAVMKIAILLFVFSGWLSLATVQSTLGFETVTDDIGFGLQRLQFPSDIALIFLLVCYSGGRRKLPDLFFLLAASIDVFLSFSRFLFAAYIVCLIIRFFRMRKLDFVSGAALSFALLLIIIFSASLSSRFSGEGSTASDTTRTEQMRYLSDSIMLHPFLGSGLGSSVVDYKRSDTIPFSYEVQWYAMAMQFGFIGLSWFFLNLLGPLLLCLESSKGRIVFIPIFAFWIAAGFTNPLIVSLGSAFGLSILMLALRKNNPHLQPHALV